MTSDMAFECVFVSRDPAVFKMMSRILLDLSISTNICLSAEKASQVLDEGNTDLVVIDWEAESSSDLLHKIWRLKTCRKPTVLAVAATDCALPGIHVILKKPVTLDSTRTCLKSAYSRMLVDHRLHTRYALMTPALASTEDGKSFLVTLMDIGDGGVGVTTKETLNVGDIISFRLSLPAATREVMTCVRVLWGRGNGRFGCEFLRIPPVDLIILHDWLRARQRIKKPLNPL